MEGIKLVEALARMEAATEPFTLRFMRLDRGRKTGGQVTEWRNCRLSQPTGVPAAVQVTAAPAEGEEASRLPAHFKNATRNLVVGASSQRRKVHIWLLLALDGQRIVLG
ncbi:MAG: hypothetical protein ACRYF0_07760 [Janthinobacterium lividum]